MSISYPPSEMIEVAKLDTEKRRDFLQSTGSKNATSDNLLACRNLPPHQHWYWHEKDQKVGDDVEDTVPEVGG